MHCGSYYRSLTFGEITLVDESRDNVSVLEVTVRIRSVIDRNVYQMYVQVVVGSKYIGGNSGREVATKFFLVRAVGKCEE